MTTAITEALRLTDRINRIEPSATMAVVAEADKLRTQGIDVVDFGAGEPHFPTPQHIKDAAIAAIPVSYTHLDVYKRQLARSSFGTGREIGRRPMGQTPAGPCPIGRRQTLCQRYNLGLLFRFAFYSLHSVCIIRPD